jgi:hypothetical protein
MLVTFRALSRSYECERRRRECRGKRPRWCVVVSNDQEDRYNGGCERSEAPRIGPDLIQLDIRPARVSICVFLWGDSPFVCRADDPAKTSAHMYMGPKFNCLPRAVAVKMRYFFDGLSRQQDDRSDRSAGNQLLQPSRMDGLKRGKGFGLVGRRRSDLSAPLRNPEARHTLSRDQPQLAFQLKTY